MPKSKKKPAAPAPAADTKPETGAPAVVAAGESRLGDYLKRCQRSLRETVTFGDLVQLERDGVIDTNPFD